MIKVFQDPVDEGIRRTAFVLMHHQPRGLVGDQQVRVLVHHAKRISGMEKIGAALSAFLKELIVEVHCDDISDRKPGTDLGPLAVKLDSLGTDALIQQGGGQQRHRLGNKFIQPLSGVILPYRKFLHVCLSFIIVIPAFATADRNRCFCTPIGGPCRFRRW